MSICVPARKLSEHKAENVRQRKNEFVNGLVQPGTTEKNTPANPSSVQPYVKGSWAVNWNGTKCFPPPGICSLCVLFCAQIWVSTQTTEGKSRSMHTFIGGHTIHNYTRKTRKKMAKWLLWLFIAGKGIPCIMIFMLSLPCCRERETTSDVFLLFGILPVFWYFLR